MVAVALRRLVDAQVLPASEQAAMLFAQGRSETAQLILEQELARRNTLDPRLWDLLFALLRAQGDWRRFDSLAQQYAASTGQAGPAWLDQPLLGRLPAALQVGGEACLALYDVEATLAERVAAVSARHAGVHLDLSRLERLDAAQAIRLTDILENLAQGTVAVVVSGTDTFTARVRALLDGRPGNLLLWRLLFALHRVQDQAEDFDLTCLEYSLATGFAAPVWDAPAAPVLPLRDVEEKRRAPRYHTPEAIRLCGRIEESSDLQLELLREGAQDRQYVNVDLSRLGRIAPSPAATLVGVVNELAGWGKVVRLLRPHALVATLLQALSLDARVQLVRAQSQLP